METELLTQFLLNKMKNRKNFVENFCREPSDSVDSFMETNQ